MNQFTVNDYPLVNGHLRMTKSGVWTAYDVLVDTDTIFNKGDSVTLKILNETFKGTLYNADVYLGFQRCTILGGSGRLSEYLDSAPYNSTTVGQIFKDIARKTGHTVSTTSDLDTLNFSLKGWNIIKMKASLALEKLLSTTKTLWRVLPDGTLWTGKEQYTTLNEKDFIIVEKFPDEGKWSIYNENYLIQPLTSLAGNNIVQVDYFIDDNTLSTDIYFDDISADSVQELTEQDDKFLYDAKYRCKVVKQNTDGNLDLLPDPNFELVSNGFVNVPIVYPFPGMRITVPVNSVCFVAFANGDPQYPRVVGWEDSLEANSVVMIHDGNQKKAARVGDEVDCGSLSVAIGMSGEVTGVYYWEPNSITFTTVPTLPAKLPIKGVITKGSSIVSIGGSSS